MAGIKDYSSTASNNTSILENGTMTHNGLYMEMVMDLSQQLMLVQHLLQSMVQM